MILLGGIVRAYAPFPSGALPGTSLGWALPGDFEASGIVWHPGLQRLFLVSDSGILASMTDGGTDLRYWNIGGDLEAVTVAFPGSDYVYLGVEHPDSVLEFNVVTGRVTRIFDLTGWMDGAKNSGLEALTFVPDAADPEGGLFYAGLQETGQIFVFRLPIRSSASRTTVACLRIIPAIQGIANLSDMYYSPVQDVLYAIYDSADLLEVLDTDGSLIGQWNLPGKDQEGITLKGSELYICQDYGGDLGGDVFRYTPFRVLPQPDLNHDGKVNFQDYALLADYWDGGLYRSAIDLNGDYRIDDADVAIFSTYWLRGF